MADPAAAVGKLKHDAALIGLVLALIGILYVGVLCLLTQTNRTVKQALSAITSQSVRKGGGFEEEKTK